MPPPRVLLLCSVLLLLQVQFAAAQAALPALADPVKITAAGKPIAVEIGHAAPFVCDMNADGKMDLLVGQFGGGKCRLYLNQGTNTEPRLDNFTLLQAAGADATVPPS